MAFLLQSLLLQLGYQQVTMRLGYPGWDTWPIPYLHVQRELEHASLAVTVKDARLHYDLTSLLRGRLYQITLPVVNVALHGHGRDPQQPCPPAEALSTGPGLLTQLTASHALQRLPVLPWDSLVLEHGRLLQTCATGPLRDLRLSATWQQHGTAFEASVTLQGEGSEPYRVEVSSTSEQMLQASLQAVAAPEQAIMTWQSLAHPVADQVELTGSVRLDVTRLPPLLRLVMPSAAAAPSLEGSLQVGWQGRVPAAVPLVAVWQHADTSLTGTTALTLRLPKAARLGDDCALAMQAEVAGNAEQAIYRLGGNLRQCAHPQLATQAVTWDIAGTLAMGGQHIWGTLARASSVQVSSARLGDVGLPNASLQLREPVAFRANRASGAWAAGPAQVDLQVPGLSWQEKAVLVRQASLRLEALRGDPAGWQMESLLSLSGAYDTVEIENLEVHFTLQKAHQTWSLARPVSVSMASVQAGMPITDVAFTLHPTWKPDVTLAWLEVGNLQAALLGGHLYSPGWRYTPGQFPQRLTVSVEQLDMQQLLQLEQQQHLEGTGRLDGVLPILLTPTGLQIQEGRLTASPPGGVLRYGAEASTAAEAAPTNAQLALVKQILANFHYQLLTLGVQYMEDGTLILQAEIKGQNPDWQQGRPIHLNLNIAENIPALLHSLQLIQGKGVEQSIQQHLQQHKATDTTRKAIR